MKKRVMVYLKIVLVATMLTLYYSHEAISSSSAQVKPPTPKVKAPAATVVTKPEWEPKWKSALTEAKKEGQLTIVSAVSSDGRAKLSRVFKDKFGVDLNWVTGRTAETFQKVTTERQAGIFNADVYYGSGGPAFSMFKEAGMLVQPSPSLLLPEVIDPTVWLGGRLKFFDRDRYILVSSQTPRNPILINSDMVNPDELRSYKDLLKPKWKGKIVMSDPNIDGAGQSWFDATLMAGVLDVDFMRQFVKQEPALVRDLRLMVEWVAKGKYPVLVGPQVGAAAEFFLAKAPVKYVVPKEGTYLTGSMGVVCIIDRAPHPKAAQVFLNWYLSKEGQRLNSEINMSHTSRLDVNVDFLPSYMMRQPGVKYFEGESEKIYTGVNESHKLIAEIFGPLTK